jgi:hypothetical protein
MYRTLHRVVVILIALALIVLHGGLVACAGGSQSAEIPSPPSQSSSQVTSPTPPANAAAPTVTITSNASVLTLGNIVTLTWSSRNADACIPTSGWNGATGVNGSFTFRPLASGTYHYGITCEGTGGTATSSTIVTVNSTESVTAPAPVIYSQNLIDAPVHAAPDDLLLLAGDGFATSDRVVYAAVSDGTSVPTQPPLAVPTTPTANVGFADIASVASVPGALAVHMPAMIAADQPYALWAVSADGRWSNGIIINDARPLWLTPDRAYQTASMASLPRALKVVGKNLQPFAGTAMTLVRLSGPATYILQAAAASNGDPVAQPHIGHYVAQVELPASMALGTYDVSVSRDGGKHWVGLLEQPPQNGGSPTIQRFTVLPDPSAPRSYPVSNYGCKPNGSDNTACIVAAIKDAAAHGGGDVLFDAGTWRFLDSSVAGVDTGCRNGIIVPKGVNLVGKGTDSTTLLRGANWSKASASATPGDTPLFSFMGSNLVHDITFSDAYIYDSNTRYDYLRLLGIGSRSYDGLVDCRTGNPISAASNVFIYSNVFDKPYIAIKEGGGPIDHLYIVNNLFGAFLTSIFFDGVPMADSIIDYNHFMPSSFLVHGSNGNCDYWCYSSGTGPIATQIAEGLRIDFSNNFADGASRDAANAVPAQTPATRFLYNPASDSTGWRAAFFWSMSFSQEMVLISENKATCTGDKAGDGESLVIDNNNNTTAFNTPRQILSASSDLSSNPTTSTITVQGTLDGAGTYTKALFAPDHYVGFWAQIEQGHGLGQVRKIIAVSPGSTTTTLVVTPAFDVLPQADSLISVTKEAWQVMMVDNYVDNGVPVCTQANIDNNTPEKPTPGVISYYGSAAASVMDGNEQHETGGIVLHAQGHTSFQTFLDVRGNVIDGEYKWDDACSGGGIVTSLTSPSSYAAVIGTFGTSIDHNVISQSDGIWGGGIVYAQTGVEGNAAGPWRVGDSSLLFHNTITGHGSSAIADDVLCGGDKYEDYAYSGRKGIALMHQGSLPLAWRTVMYGNRCDIVTTDSSSAYPLYDLGTGTQRYCPSGVVAGSCECEGAVSIDVKSAASASSTRIANGGSIHFNVAVTNSGTVTATRLRIILERSTGIQFVSSSLGTNCNLDSNGDVCSLPDLPVGQTATATFTAVATAPGNWPVNFTVTHAEPDTDLLNDSTSITETVTP